MSFYHEIFNKVEETLKQQSKLSEENFNSRFGEYKSYKSRSYSDEDYYKILIEIIFYSGFRAETVDNKMDSIKKHLPSFSIVASYDDGKISEIMNDTSMIRNEKKIKGCVKNARIFTDTIIEYGSFQNYLDSLKAEESFENLMLLKEEIEYKFDYIGGITAYHFILPFIILFPDNSVPV